MVRNSDVGNKLRELRGNRSREEVSAALGISKSALTMYELGYRNPRDVIKVLIADYYGVGVGDIFFAGHFTKSAV